LPECFENNIKNYKKMYRGFNLELNEDIFFNEIINYCKEKAKRKKIKLNEDISFNEIIDYYIEIAKRENLKLVKHFPFLNVSTLKEEIILDAKQIMKEYFPQYNRFDIFLSHSHNDLNLALAIAGMLKEKFHLKVFVDSIVWKNCTDLLRSIDNEYCRIKKGSYDYNKRNYSTSHVYLILMNSLNMMIDECETLFFLNTPNSISLEDNLDNLDGLDRTLSPWIFSEIQTSKIIRKKIPNRNIPLMESTKYFSKDLKISYSLELDHLTEMSQDDFLKWIYSDYDNPNEALDNLYKMYPLDYNINIDFS
jgi:hypothetical protein